MQTMIDTEADAGSPSFTWDTNTALAALVFGALLFLMAVSRGFRGLGS